MFAMRRNRLSSSPRTQKTPGISARLRWHAACREQRSKRQARRIPDGVPPVATQRQRMMAIADIIEQYVIEHPHAADTPEGIRAWWVGRAGSGDSLDDVQAALDHLLERGRVSRTLLPDGTTIYGAATPNGSGKD
jgi:hypothetical protein